MIKEEDCCDDCLDGEPCCDEDLAEPVVPKKSSKVVKKIKTAGVTADIEQLARHLCCQTRFYHIYNAMNGLSKEQLIELRDQLRSYTPTNSLHHHLNAEFSKAIGE